MSLVNIVEGEQRPWPVAGAACPEGWCVEASPPAETAGGSLAGTGLADSCRWGPCHSAAVSKWSLGCSLFRAWSSPSLSLWPGFSHSTILEF